MGKNPYNESSDFVMLSEMAAIHFFPLLTTPTPYTQNIYQRHVYLSKRYIEL